MARIVAPGLALLHTSVGPAKVPPAVMSTKIPSSCAGERLYFIASAPAMVITRLITPVSMASAVSFGKKSGLQPCIGWGLNRGLGLAGEPSGLRSLCEPEETIGASIFKTRYSKHDYKHREPLPSSSPIASDAGRWCASILLRWFLDSCKRHSLESAPSLRRRQYERQATDRYSCRRSPSPGPDLRRGQLPCHCRQKENGRRGC